MRLACSRFFPSVFSCSYYFIPHHIRGLLVLLLSPRPLHQCCSLMPLLTSSIFFFVVEHSICYLWLTYTSKTTKTLGNGVTTHIILYTFHFFSSPTPLLSAPNIPVLIRTSPSHCPQFSLTTSSFSFAAPYFVAQLPIDSCALCFLGPSIVAPYVVLSKYHSTTVHRTFN